MRTNSLAILAMVFTLALAGPALAQDNPTEDAYGGVLGEEVANNDDSGGRTGEHARDRPGRAGRGRQRRLAAVHRPGARARRARRHRPRVAGPRDAASDAPFLELDPAQITEGLADLPRRFGVEPAPVQEPRLGDGGAMSQRLERAGHAPPALERGQIAIEPVGACPQRRPRRVGHRVLARHDSQQVALAGRDAREVERDRGRRAAVDARACRARGRPGGRERSAAATTPSRSTTVAARRAVRRRRRPSGGA